MLIRSSTTYASKDGAIRSNARACIGGETGGILAGRTVGWTWRWMTPRRPPRTSQERTKTTASCCRLVSVVDLKQREDAGRYDGATGTQRQKRRVPLPPPGR